VLQLSLHLLFFTKHEEKQAQKFCKDLSRRKGVKKAKLVSIYPDLDSEHIHAYVSAPPSQLPETERLLKRLGKAISQVTGISDVIVQVMGYPDMVYRTLSD